jgi:hypothetical protein
MSGWQENACKSCGWRGITVADTRAAWFGRAYIVVAVAAVAADALKVVDLRKVLNWPVAMAIAVVLPLVPFLLGRARRCPQCRRRELEIVPKNVAAG